MIFLSVQTKDKVNVIFVTLLRAADVSLFLFLHNTLFGFEGI